MKKIIFNLQDTPDFWKSFDIDLQFGENNECTVSDEIAIAILIKKKFPELYECHRRVKKLIVIDDNGNKYTSDDFDFPGSLKKVEE